MVNVIYIHYYYGGYTLLLIYSCMLGVELTIFQYDNVKFSHELPEIQASSKLDSILCNGDLSEPESDSEVFFGKHVL